MGKWLLNSYNLFIASSLVDCKTPKSLKNRGNNRKVTTMMRVLFFIILATSLAFSDTGYLQRIAEPSMSEIPKESHASTASDQENPSTGEKTLRIPAYRGRPYVEINSNIPFFHGEKPLPENYENYSPLDALGRCGVAEANLSVALMPTGKRGPIGMIKPSGWHTIRYDATIDKKYLYNRCHLIGFQLAGENANERNLITGTRYLNTEGMLPFEKQLAGYVKRTRNHVRYRVTPVFMGDELVARGVLLEAESVEDNGRGISFNVYCYNVQPGIEIEYLTGESYVAQ